MRRRQLIVGVLLLGLLGILMGMWAAQTTPSVVSTDPDVSSRRARSALPVRTNAPPRALLLSGSVQTVQGLPIEGIQVGFLSTSESTEVPARMPDQVVRTDASGRFSLQVDGAGQVMVVSGATPPRVHVDSSRSDLVFRRGDSCALDVAVVDADGRPAANYQFRLSYGDATMPPSVLSMPTGTFESDHSGQIRLEHAPCGSLQFSSASDDQAPLETASVDSLLNTSVTLRLLPAVSIRGVVVDSEGQPVSGGVVSASWSTNDAPIQRLGGGRAFPSVTDNGQFEMTVPPEVSVRVVAWSEPFTSDVVVLTTPALGDAPLEIKLQIPAGRLIKAHCPDDKTACGEPDATLKCTWRPDDSEEWTTQECTLASDARSFDCPCGPAGSKIRSEGVFETAEVEANQSEVMLIRQSSPFDGAERRTVRGTVSLVPGGGACAVSFASAQGAAHRTREFGACDSSGTFDLALPVGHALWVEVTQGSRSSRVRVDAAASNTTLPPMGLDGTASLRVTVVGSDGEFVSGSMVSVQIKSEKGGPLTDAGIVRSAAGADFDRLPAGTYTVAVLDFNTTHNTTETVVVTDDGAHELEVELETESRP